MEIRKIMSTMVVTTRITHKYLMNKSKWELASWIMDDLDKIDKLADEIRALDKSNTWIHVDKAEPEKDTVVWGFGTQRNGDVLVDQVYLSSEDKRWYTNNINNCVNVTYWQEILPPAPPTGENE
jgi:hypothetical protein